MLSLNLKDNQTNKLRLLFKTITRFPPPLMLRYFVAQFAPKPLEPPQYAKHERISNFLSVPFQLEKVNFAKTKSLP